MHSPFNHGIEIDHEKLRQKLSKCTRSPHPSLLIVAGPSRAGKSSVIEWIEGHNDRAKAELPQMGNSLDKGAVRIDSEFVKDFAPRLKKFNTDKFKGTAISRHYEHNEENRQYYGQIRNALVVEALRSGKSVILDDNCWDILQPEETNVKHLIIAVRELCPDANIRAIGVIMHGDKFEGIIDNDFAKDEINVHDYNLAVRLAQYFFPIINSLAGWVDRTVIIDNSGTKLTDDSAPSPKIIADYYRVPSAHQSVANNTCEAHFEDGYALRNCEKSLQLLNPLKRSHNPMQQTDFDRESILALIEARRKARAIQQGR